MAETTTLTALATQTNSAERAAGFLKPHLRKLNRNLAAVGAKARFVLDEKVDGRAGEYCLKKTSGGLGFISFGTRLDGSVEYEVKTMANASSPSFPEVAEDAATFFQIACHELAGTLLLESDRLLLDKIGEQGSTKRQTAYGATVRTAERLGLTTPGL